jgi:Lipocalin-like domain
LTDGLALLGTWKMVSWIRKVVATGAITDVMGTDPIGYIAYHANGRMMATVFHRDRHKPGGAAPTAEEKISLFDSMLAYVAAYTLEDGKVVHHVEAAWNPVWQFDLIRPFTLDGDKLVISDAPGLDPARAKK